MSFRESYKTVYGVWIGKTVIGICVGDKQGGFDRVDFDWDVVFRRRRFVVGFYHTHPGRSASPSDIDNKTMNACVVALGKSLLCLIEPQTRSYLTAIVYARGKKIACLRRKLMRLSDSVFLFIGGVNEKRHWSRNFVEGKEVRRNSGGNNSHRRRGGGGEQFSFVSGKDGF